MYWGKFMTGTEVLDALAGAISEVLETMFFEEVVGDAPVPSEGLAARVAFNGAPSGVFTLAADRRAARSLAASFLALENSEVTELQMGEVIREMTNMICGSVLSRLEPQAALELRAPELVPPASAAGLCCSLAFGCGMLAVWIDLESQS